MPQARSACPKRALIGAGRMRGRGRSGCLCDARSAARRASSARSSTPLPGHERPQLGWRDAHDGELRQARHGSRTRPRASERGISSGPTIRAGQRRSRPAWSRIPGDGGRDMATTDRWTGTATELLNETDGGWPNRRPSLGIGPKRRRCCRGTSGGFNRACGKSAWSSTSPSQRPRPYPTCAGRPGGR